MNGTITIHHLYLSGGHDFKGRFNLGRLNHKVVEREAVECVAGRGLVGDRFYDYKPDFKGQLSLISVEAIEAVKRRLGISVEDPSLFRRNGVVSGVELNQLVGQDFRVGDVVFRGTEQCKPCFWMNEAIGEGAFEALEGLGGLRCKILTGGELKVGEWEISQLQQAS